MRTRSVETSARTARREPRSQRLYYHNGVFGALASLPSVPFAPEPTPVEELPRLRAALGGGPRLLVKRDDAIGFAFGGNKVRKMRLVAADALARQADTLITCGGVQSNHARVTAAAAARLGLRCVLVANGAAPDRPTANALLDGCSAPRFATSPTREARAPRWKPSAAAQRAAGPPPVRRSRSAPRRRSAPPRLRTP